MDDTIEKGDGRVVFLFFFFKENIISPMEDSPIPDISGKDVNDGAGTSPRSQGKAFRYCFFFYFKTLK